MARMKIAEVRIDSASSVLRALCVCRRKDGDHERRGKTQRSALWLACNQRDEPCNVYLRLTSRVSYSCGMSEEHGTSRGREWFNDRRTLFAIAAAIWMT